MIAQGPWHWGLQVDKVTRTSWSLAFCGTPGKAQPWGSLAVPHTLTSMWLNRENLGRIRPAFNMFYTFLSLLSFNLGWRCTAPQNNNNNKIRFEDSDLEWRENLKASLKFKPKLMIKSSFHQSYALESRVLVLRFSSCSFLHWERRVISG